MPAPQEIIIESASGKQFIFTPDVVAKQQNVIRDLLRLEFGKEVAEEIIERILKTMNTRIKTLVSIGPEYIIYYEG